MRHAWLLGVLLALACTATQPTEVVGGVTSQIKVPEYLRSVGLTVQAEGKVVFCQSYPVTDGFTTLPATLGVLGTTGVGARSTVTVQVLGLRAEESQFDQDCIVRPSEPGELNNREVLVIRRRRFTFVDDRIVYLPLPLKESCTDVACPPDQTCIAGACVPMDIDAKTLPDYEPRMAFGDTNTCFSGRNCLPSGGTFPAFLVDPANCTFRIQWDPQLPAYGPGDLNVRLFYDSFGTEILDRDPANTPPEQQEGFSFPDPNDPLTFRLAPNLCNSNYRIDKVLAVEASALCPSKRIFQPLCEDYQPPNPRSSNSEVTSTAGAGLCTLAQLEPIESVVYVLMDNSFRMYPFYGNGGLRFAVELPLASPVASRAQVAFDQFPAQAAECRTDAYATPLVPFGNVTETRGPIANILATELDQTQRINPPEVFLEAALQGAYTAVTNARVVNPDQAAQRAVVVISNRDINVGACMGAPTALELAQAAAQSPARIATYAVALGDPNEDNPIADASTVASATALANAGGTRVFNGVADGAQGARAVLDVLTELGTCSYRVNRLDLGLDGAAQLPDTALISYVDPLFPSGSAVDIALNPACVAGAPAEVSGWNRDGERVRICGKACSDLRAVISNVTALHVLQTPPLVAPPVPVVISAPCNNFVLRTGAQ